MQRAFWPGWVLPRTRPRGRATLLWLIHPVLLLTAIAAGVVLPIWRSGGTFRWIILGVVAFSLAVTPWVISLPLRMRWNAPEAERRNRELLGSDVST